MFMLWAGFSSCCARTHIQHTTKERRSHAICFLVDEEPERTRVNCPRWCRPVCHTLLRTYLHMSTTLCLKQYKINCLHNYRYIQYNVLHASFIIPCVFVCTSHHTYPEHMPVGIRKRYLTSSDFDPPPPRVPYKGMHIALWYESAEKASVMHTPIAHMY